MSYYVYKYMWHDSIPIYIGSTNNLERRLKTHANSSVDNIDRKFLPLLKESKIYYYICENEEQMLKLESFLIAKYKPRINKKDKYNSKILQNEIKIPNKWIPIDEKLATALNPLTTTNILYSCLMHTCAKYKDNIAAISGKEIRQYFQLFPDDSSDFATSSFKYNEGRTYQLFALNSQIFVHHLEGMGMINIKKMDQKDWGSEIDKSNLFDSIKFLPDEEYYLDMMKYINNKLRHTALESKRLALIDKLNGLRNRYLSIGKEWSNLTSK